jgi:hypothetical protein
MGAIVVLLEQLPLQALAKLIEVDGEDIAAALWHLPSVIAVPKKATDITRFYHPSFPDFITDPARCEDTRFLIDPGHHHHKLASRCFSIMFSLLKRNICGIQHHSKLNSELEDLPLKITTSIPSWLRYSCLNWATHLEHVICGDVEVKQIIEKFCATYLLYWVEAISLLDSMSLVLPTIRRAKKWAVSCLYIGSIKKYLT